jgi:hypothetical protein
MTKANPTILKEWREGTPPQGKYLLDTGKEQIKVDVGHNVFTWLGKTHHISKAFEMGKLLGPISEKSVAAQEVSTPVLSLPPGISAEADAAIRLALRTLASTPMRKTGPTIAPKLIEVYGDVLRAVRAQNHGWQKIAKVFRAQGLHVGEKSLKVGFETN